MASWSYIKCQQQSNQNVLYLIDINEKEWEADVKPCHWKMQIWTEAAFLEQLLTFGPTGFQMETCHVLDFIVSISRDFSSQMGRENLKLHVQF